MEEEEQPENRKQLNAQLLTRGCGGHQATLPGDNQGNKALRSQRKAGQVGRAQDRWEESTGQVGKAQGLPQSLLHFPLKSHNKDPQFPTFSPKRATPGKKQDPCSASPSASRVCSQTGNAKSPKPSVWCGHHCATLSPPAWLWDQPLTPRCSGAPVPRTLLCCQLCPDVSATAAQRDCRRREATTPGRVSGVEVNSEVLPGNLATKPS